MGRKALPQITMAEAVDNFLNSLPPDLSQSARNQKSYTLRILVRNCAKGQYTLTRNLKPHNFTDCVNDLFSGASDGENQSRKLKGHGVRTGRRGSALEACRVTLRQFIRHLIYRKWVEAAFNPFYEITKTAKDHAEVDPSRVRIHRRIPLSDWDRVLNLAEHPRDRLILCLGLWWGQRASTMTHILWKHLDLTANTVTLYNIKKGRYVSGGRPLPVANKVREEIDRYLAWFTPRYGTPNASWPMIPAKTPSSDLRANLSDRANWPLQPHKPMAERDMGQAIRRVLETYWPNENLLGEGGHTLRRSAAAAMKQTGGIEATQRLLDHKHVEQTYVYAGDQEEHAKLAETMAGGYDTDPDPDPEPTPQDTTAPVIDMFSRRRVA